VLGGLRPPNTPFFLPHPGNPQRALPFIPDSGTGFLRLNYRLRLAVGGAGFMRKAVRPRPLYDNAFGFTMTILCFRSVWYFRVVVPRIDGRNDYPSVRNLAGGGDGYPFGDKFRYSKTKEETNAAATSPALRAPFDCAQGRPPLQMQKTFGEGRRPGGLACGKLNC